MHVTDDPNKTLFLFNYMVKNQTYSVYNDDMFVFANTSSVTQVIGSLCKYLPLGFPTHINYTTTILAAFITFEDVIGSTISFLGMTVKLHIFILLGGMSIS